MYDEMEIVINMDQENIMKLSLHMFYFLGSADWILGLPGRDAWPKGLTSPSLDFNNNYLGLSFEIKFPCPDVNEQVPWNFV